MSKDARQETATQQDDVEAPDTPIWLQIIEDAASKGPKYVVVGLGMMYLVDIGVPLWVAALAALFAPAVATLLVAGFVAVFGIALLEVMDVHTPDAIEGENTLQEANNGENNE